MGRKICLSKTIVLFYLILAPFIIYASIHNLINVINGTGSTITLGAFALFGFILLPIAIISSYTKNICHIQADKITIGKNEFRYADYQFYITEYELPLKDRPLVSLLKKKYKKLTIRDRKNQGVVFENNLDVFPKDIQRLENTIPIEKSK